MARREKKRGSLFFFPASSFFKTAASAVPRRPVRPFRAITRCKIDRELIETSLRIGAGVKGAGLGPAAGRHFHVFDIECLLPSSLTAVFFPLDSKLGHVPPSNQHSTSHPRLMHVHAQFGCSAIGAGGLDRQALEPGKRESSISKKSGKTPKDISRRARSETRRPARRWSRILHLPTFMASARHERSLWKEGSERGEAHWPREETSLSPESG